MKLLYTQRKYLLDLNKLKYWNTLGMCQRNFIRWQLRELFHTNNLFIYVLPITLYITFTYTKITFFMNIGIIFSLIEHVKYHSRYQDI